MLLLAALSSATLFAIERANIDVAVFLLVLGAVHLLSRGPGKRLLGYATLLAAAAIKFYPASILILAARERENRFLAIAVSSAAIALPAVVLFSRDLGHVVTQLPQGNPFIDIFAASNLPFGLAALANGGDTDNGAGYAIRIISITLLVGVTAVLVRHFVPMVLPGLRALAPKERSLLVAGSTVIAFCFFAAKNTQYREIFLILTLPGLWAMERGAGNWALGEHFRFGSWLVVGLLWTEFFRGWSNRLAAALFDGHFKLGIQLLVWISREFLWWWLVSLLISLTICFLWDAPILLRLRERMAARTLLRAP